MATRKLLTYIPLSPRIFLSYVSEDEERVEHLYQRLSDAACKPWMGKKDILPGEAWEPSIERAIRAADFFLACLSTNSVNTRGVIQREIKRALDIWQEKLDHDIYLMPIRLEDCEIPESLRRFQWVDIFEEEGWARLVEAIKVGLERQDKLQRIIIDDDPRVVMALYRFKVAEERRKEAFQRYEEREVDFDYVRKFMDDSGESSRKHIGAIEQVYQEWINKIKESGGHII